MSDIKKGILLIFYDLVCCKRLLSKKPLVYDQNGNSEQDITIASNLYRICLLEHKTI
ncbi:hypothetical protein APHNP_1765 [Anaplasma phagocytophilum str. ApNP]|uniref:Uncharacterized protein n=1 Tax=Anaplasma phagocytophilum str. ApNP TaxID=1359153 RepID=A0A0F3NFR7_ANAPH|nr:hypothetical protein APHNP_1765 [Anaplasma phagocytophilum str. ApNP]